MLCLMKHRNIGHFDRLSNLSVRNVRVFTKCGYVCGEVHRILFNRIGKQNNIVRLNFYYSAAYFVNQFISIGIYNRNCAAI